jgi:hypothetical protein
VYFYERNPKYRGEFLGYLVAIVIAVLPVLLALFLRNVLMRFAGGRRSVEKVFRAKEPVRGGGWSAYGAVGRMVQNTLEFHTADDGIFVGRPQFFDRLNRRLFIPWTDLHDAAERKNYTVERMVTLKISDPQVGRLVLPARVLEGSPGNFLLDCLSVPTPKSS